MFKEIREIDKLVVDRIVDKITEQNLPIEMEIGVVKEGMVKVLFIYPNHEQLNLLVTESINEEYDLCGL